MCVCIYVWTYIYIHIYTHVSGWLVFCLIFLEMSDDQDSHNWFLSGLDEYVCLNNSFHFAQGENALFFFFWQFRIQKFDLLGLRTPFLAMLCLAITILLSKKVNKSKKTNKQKTLHWLVSLTKYHQSCLNGVELSAIYVNACNFHNKQVHKKYILFR